MGDSNKHRPPSGTTQPEDHRDIKSGTYDVDPATAKDAGQGEYGGQLPEGLSRERKGPLGPTQGRRQK